MYSRYPNYRFSGGVKVPENYSGNAFKPSETGEERIIEAELAEADSEEVGAESGETVQTVSEESSEDTVQTFKDHSSKGLRFPGFKFDIGRIFSGGFGFEEILLIGLILLISQNGQGDDDIILLLALLLFIG